MKSRWIVLALLVAGLLSLVPAQARGAAGHPPGVPDLTDPSVLDQFIPMGVSGLNGDPDFPLLLLAKRAGGPPQLLLVIVDARNGKDTWSFREDATVLYVLFADPMTVQGGFLDEGFAATGKPSGHFIGAGPETLEELMGLLHESHRRSRGLARLGLGI